MPILNYTSTVAATRSLAEIQQRLAAHGAQAVTVVYEEREPIALAFTIEAQTFRLPANIDAMETILQRIPRATKTRAQACRVAWRIIKDWVEAQLALIEARQVSLEQVMLPYLELRPGGPTLYEAYLREGRKLLGVGKHD